MIKQLGLIGLGKMGFNLIQNIKRNGFEPVGYDVNHEIYQKLSSLSIDFAASIDEMINKLTKPRYVMMMVPAGDITEQMIETLVSKLESGDVIVDAGNSNYKDTLRHNDFANEKGINFVDCGTSGGTSGALNGACFMVGGNDIVMRELRPFFEKLAVPNGFLHTGRTGSGHFAKMIHNGIEYGMMEAIGEGFQLIENSEFDYNKEELARVWNHGSVIRSWLIELTQEALKKDPDLNEITGYMSMNGEGTWTVIEALQQGTPIPVISLSVQMRQRSWEDDTFSGKVVAALRNEFGGHGFKIKNNNPIINLEKNLIISNEN